MTGLEITAGQRTMTGLKSLLTNQFWRWLATFIDDSIGISITSTFYLFVINVTIRWFSQKCYSKVLTTHVNAWKIVTTHRKFCVPQNMWFVLDLVMLICQNYLYYSDRWKPDFTALILSPEYQRRVLLSHLIERVKLSLKYEICMSHFVHLKVSAI